MQIECDFALLGSGIAPLIAAQNLLRQGYSVLILNPDHDFFRENSELPLEPVLPADLTREEVKFGLSLQRFERARELLAPEYPGPIEAWPRETRPSSSREFRDPSAPYLRMRQWNWVPEWQSGIPDSSFDDHFLHFLESGWKPQTSQGIAAARKFPGYNSKSDTYPSFQSLSVGKLVDVDLDRYRNGVLEFIRSRLSSERILTSVHSLEMVNGGLRFHHEGAAAQVRPLHGIWAFWTPRLGGFVEKTAAQLKQSKLLPTSTTRGWEEWTLRSREPLDSLHVGITPEAVAWARFEGEPTEASTELSVLMPASAGAPVAGAESFARLSRFVRDFLHWERLTIRDLKTRWFTGLDGGEWTLTGADFPVHVISGVEGSLVRVVERVGRFSSAQVQRLQSEASS